MKLTTVGIDLAKNVFQVHGIDEHDKVLVKKQLRRDQMATFFVNLPPCLIGMEACGSAHHWARKLQAMGHTVRLMAPQFVKPYVKTNKNDAADAEAICEAVARPNMRFVPIKNVEQQAVLSLHRVRQGFVKARTAQANQIRGLLSEFGLIVPKGISYIASRVPELIEDAANELPGSFRVLVQRMLDHLKDFGRQVEDRGDLERGPCRIDQARQTRNLCHCGDPGSERKRETRPQLSRHAERAARFFGDPGDPQREAGIHCLLVSSEERKRRHDDPAHREVSAGSSSQIPPRRALILRAGSGSSLRAANHRR